MKCGVSCCHRTALGAESASFLASGCVPDFRRNELRHRKSCSCAAGMRPLERVYSSVSGFGNGPGPSVSCARWLICLVLIGAMIKFDSALNRSGGSARSRARSMQTLIIPVIRYLQMITGHSERFATVGQSQWRASRKTSRCSYSSANAIRRFVPRHDSSLSFLAARRSHPGR